MHSNININNLKYNFSSLFSVIQCENHMDQMKMIDSFIRLSRNDTFI